MFSPIFLVWTSWENEYFLSLSTTIQNGGNFWTQKVQKSTEVLAHGVWCAGFSPLFSLKAAQPFLSPYRIAPKPMFQSLWGFPVSLWFRLWASCEVSQLGCLHIGDQSTCLEKSWDPIGRQSLCPNFCTLVSCRSWGADRLCICRRVNEKTLSAALEVLICS